MATTLEFATPLHPGQQEIWNALNEFGNDNKYRYRRIVANTGRQVGKTTLAKRVALHWAINCPGL